MSNSVKYLILALLLAAFWVVDAQAQSPNYSEDDGINLWRGDSFLDNEDVDAPMGEDGSGAGFIGDEQVKQMEEAARLAAGPGHNLAAALEQDKKLLPDNVMYGLGTGLALGGWIALLQGKNGRQNAQYLGTGIVLGGLLGVMVGTKSVYQPLLRRSSLDPTPAIHGWALMPVLNLESKGQAHAGMGLSFRF
ncbi:MAG: hypothetical protein A2527_02850 [Candidatus Lambdaproteobacteria bacterium RIFOXYD2_FULL_50_16]|uniref:Uncharacterized protein n=1 Tax=Candidatus Lambdaproteobacteria bacterium RIFOXYD2_FULL_50_16 TaxID=1817772 RepID=A0A1F6GFY1_9PROT|nr:MAG: hypothetical protein A2527_02850 [Candidatus Lambdaproteobacteria bacterium RIFOXYD2_FULL_50_16]